MVRAVRAVPFFGENIVSHGTNALDLFGIDTQKLGTGSKSSTIHGHTSYILEDAYQKQLKPGL